MADRILVDSEILLLYASQIEKISNSLNSVASSLQSANNMDSSTSSYRPDGCGCRLSWLGSNISSSTVRSTLNSYDNAMKQYVTAMKGLASNIRKVSGLFSDTERMMLKIISEDLDSALQENDRNASWVEKTRYLADIAATSALHATRGSSDNGCCFNGDPVNMANGNFIYTRSFLSFNEASVPIELKLFYNSLDEQSGCLSTGWTHNYAVRLDWDEDHPSVRLEDGRLIYFSQGTDCYVAIHSSESVLKKTSAGFQLEHDDGTTYSFDRDGSLLSLSHEDDAVITLKYDSNHRLSAIYNGLGDGYSFSYRSKGELKSITDTQERKLLFDYHLDHLIAITEPDGCRLDYRYDSHGLLESATDKRGIAMFRNEYDEVRRVLRQTMPDGGIMSYQYDDENRRILYTEPNGNNIVYEHDHRYLSSRTLWNNGEEKHLFDEHHRRISSIDKLGRITTYAYDQQGNLSRVTDPMGATVEMVYTPARRLSEVRKNGSLIAKAKYDHRQKLVIVEDGLGRTERYGYDESGMLCSASLPESGTLLFQNDGKGNVIASTSARGHVSHYEYDSFHHVTARIDARGNRTEFDYDINGRVIGVRDALGQRKTFEYNESGDLIAVHDVDGASESWEYNAFHQPIQYTDKLGRKTKFEYDTMQCLVRRIDPNGGETCFSYNEHKKLQMVTDPEGHVQRLTYDACGNLIRREKEDGGIFAIDYDALNRIIGVTDPAGVKVSAIYNEMGHLTCVTDGAGGCYVAEYNVMGEVLSEHMPNGRTIRYHYYPSGLVESVEDDYGILKRFVYEQGGLLQKEESADGTTQTYTYDENDNLVRCVNQDNYEWLFEYDALDRLIAQHGSNGSSERYTYDAVGQIASVTDAFGHTTHYEYSPTGQLTGVVDALGNGTYYSYDKMDRLDKIVRPMEGLLDLREVLNNQQTEGTARVTSFKRDLMGRIRLRTDASGASIGYEYDECGRVKAIRDADGFLTRYGYTPDGLPATIEYADGRSVNMEYSPLKRLSKLNDWLGSALIEYDSAGNPVSIRDQTGNSFNFSYNLRGERTGIEYPDQTKAEYRYDNASRLVRASIANDAIDYEYGTNGLLSCKKMPQGITARFAYDAFGQMTERVHIDPQGELDRFEYTYDEKGRRSSITVSRRDLPDENGRVAYQYDPVGSLIAVLKDGNPLRSYSYDAFGNRIIMNDQAGRTTYRYNELDQLLSRTKGGVTSSYHYDRRGNMVSAEGTKRYTFDAANRLTGAQEGDASHTYKYDGFGLRVARRSESSGKISEYKYLLDKTSRFDNLLGISGPDGKMTILRDDNALLGINGSMTSIFLSAETQSLLRTVQGAGCSIPYVTDEFGLPLSAAGMPFGFGGYRDDGLEDLLFAQRREYNPQLGRFVSQDIIEGRIDHPQTLNRYTYCRNDPINYYDPSGCLAAWLAVGLINAARRVVTTAIVDTIKTVATGKNQFSSWQTYSGAAVGGFVEGTVFVASGGNAAIAGASGAAAETFTTGALNIVSGSKDATSWGDLMINTGVSAAVGAVEGFAVSKVSTKINGISKGKWSLDSRYRGQVTKALSGETVNFGPKTIVNGIVTQVLMRGGVDTAVKETEKFAKDKLKDWGKSVLKDTLERGTSKPLPTTVPGLNQSTCLA